MRQSILNASLISEERKIRSDSFDADEPSQTFYVPLPERDRHLVKITTNPPEYSLIENDSFSFSACKSVYIEPNLFAFFGDPFNLEVWQY